MSGDLWVVQTRRKRARGYLHKMPTGNPLVMAFVENATAFLTQQEAQVAADEQNKAPKSTVAEHRDEWEAVRV